MDFYKPKECYGPGPNMMCTEQWLFPQCQSFYKDVSPDEWQECLRRPELYRGDGYDYENEIRMMAEGKGDVGMYDKKDNDYYATIASSMAPLSALSVGVLAAMASF